MHEREGEKNALENSQRMNIWMSDQKQMERLETKEKYKIRGSTALEGNNSSNRKWIRKHLLKYLSM